MHPLNTPVERAMREVAMSIVLPRFRNLSQDEIKEKTPGEIVTIADRLSEAALRAMLSPLVPGARVVGEEGCTDDPGQLAGIAQGDVWIVDPIDGTSNYAAGKGPFGIIIALAHDGVTEATWIYDPLRDRMCHAARGQGAFVDGAPVACQVDSPARPVAGLATQFMAPALRERVLECATKVFDVVPIPKCAAEHYPRLALGENHVAVFQRTLPWDHAGGALFLTEAGGKVTRWDGSDYAFGDNGLGILAASNVAAWSLAFRTLKQAEPDLREARLLIPQYLTPPRDRALPDCLPEHSLIGT